MNSIEQAREAQYRCPVCKVADEFAYLRCHRPDCTDGRDPRPSRPYTYREAVQPASPTTPVDGVGAEAVGYGVFRNGECIGFVGLGEEFRLSEDTDERRPLYAAPLANPQAEARLRERVAVPQKLIDDVLDMALYLPGCAKDRIEHYQDAANRLANWAADRNAEARLAQAEGGPAVTEAMRDVLAERRRQVDAEGWTPSHDDTHADGALARAAGLYALVAGSDPATYRNAQHGRHRRDGSPLNDYHAAALRLWPWDWSWFKPTSRRRDLVKAGALILAEIERLDRAALHPQLAAGEEGK